MKVSAVQLLVRGDQSPGERLDAARAAIAAEAEGGADLVVLPEMWPVGYFDFDGYAASAEPLDGPLVGPLSSALSDAARRAGVNVCGGSMVERDGAALHNTTVLFDRAGTLVASYRKIHLYGYGSKEQQVLTPGTEIAVTTLDGLTIGLSTCYDVRFPELYRRMVDAGAELFVVVAGWPFPRVDAWRCLCRARAIENQAGFVGCNAAGSQGRSTFAGSSIAFNAWGTPLGELDDRPGVLRADIDPDAIRAARAEFPALVDRRLREGT